MNRDEVIKVWRLGNCKREELVFDAFIDFEQVERAYGSDMAGLRSFNDSTSSRVLESGSAGDGIIIIIIHIFI